MRFKETMRTHEAREGEGPVRTIVLDGAYCQDVFGWCSFSDAVSDDPFLLKVLELHRSRTQKALRVFPDDSEDRSLHCVTAHREMTRRVLSWLYDERRSMKKLEGKVSNKAERWILDTAKANLNRLVPKVEEMSGKLKRIERQLRRET
jgi:hypothetical protein